MLLDIVSKNGNLMLNIPVRGDGTIDEDEVKFLQGMAAWMDVNGEAIFATRPWKLSGEGPVKTGGGAFNEGARPYTAKDFRFTTKGNVLYATALAWPEDGKLTVRVLGSGAMGLAGKVKRVSLLGSPEKLAWSRPPRALSSRCRHRSRATMPMRSKLKGWTWLHPSRRCRFRSQSTRRRTVPSR